MQALNKLPEAALALLLLGASLGLAGGAAAQDCEGLLARFDAALGGADELDADLRAYLSELRAEATEHLGSGDQAACEAAISQGLELLDAQ